MKKIYSSLIMCFLVTIAFAQKDTVHLRGMQKSIKAIVTDRPPQAVYFQFGGSGPILSVNYDRRFSKKVNGPGFVVGAGFWGESGISIFSIPVSLNYLFGKRSSFFEIAAGTTFVTATALDLFDTEDDKNSGFIHHINFGYRYQPTNGGFFFRGGVSPLFVQGEYVTSYYIGFGHNF